MLKFIAKLFRILKPLSKEKHYEHGEDGDEHNRDYDHEAFLGKDADDFDELPPEESKARLKLD